MTNIFRSLAIVTALLVGAGATPALAGTWIDDGAAMLTPTTASQLDAKLQSFTAQTHKQIVVITVPTTSGVPIAQAAQSAYAQRGVNGFVIYIAKNDRRDIILPGRTEISSGWFSRSGIADIQSTMQSSFKSGDFDGGISGAVNAILSIYHSHLGSLNRSGGTLPNYGNSTPLATQSSGGFHVPGWFWFLAILFVLYLIVRSILRAIFGGAGRMTGGGATPMAPMGGAPMGGPMGGMGGGGGGFWSGMLGGLGGAFIGNELFGNHGGSNMMGGPADASQMNGGDSAGWGTDAGQSDLSGSAGGDWSGGGFGDSGGGGDFGGGGDGGGGGW